MSSEKQIEANRRNAQKSKGPRTAAGKARASRNSCKHALCTINRINPLYAPRIEAIARAICSEATNAELWDQALIIGECTTLLACAQAERIALIEASLRKVRPSRVPRTRLWHLSSLPRPKLRKLRPCCAPRMRLWHLRSLPRPKLRKLHARLLVRAWSEGSRYELREANRSQSEERAKKQGTAHSCRQSARQPQ